MNGGLLQVFGRGVEGGAKAAGESMQMMTKQKMAEFLEEKKTAALALRQERLEELRHRYRLEEIGETGKEARSTQEASKEKHKLIQEREVLEGMFPGEGDKLFKDKYGGKPKDITVGDKLKVQERMREILEDSPVTQATVDKLNKLARMIGEPLFKLEETGKREKAGLLDFGEPEGELIKRIIQTSEKARIGEDKGFITDEPSSMASQSEFDRLKDLINKEPEESSKGILETPRKKLSGATGTWEEPSRMPKMTEAKEGIVDVESMKKAGIQIAKGIDKTHDALNAVEKYALDKGLSLTKEIKDGLVWWVKKVLESQKQARKETFVGN